jgi:putative restriction endonuclease
MAGATLFAPGSGKEASRGAKKGVAGSPMDPTVLASYMRRLATLHRNSSRLHGPAPHKPILLLALLDEIQRGTYCDNLITVTADLVASFRAYWQALVSSDHWSPRMEHPFRYMRHEGFWDFVRGGEVVLPADKPYTLNQINADFDGVRIAPELWQLLQDRTALNALRTHLMQAYFGRGEVHREATESVLDYEAERLKAEASSRFRTGRIREPKDEGYFVRHVLFPRVVRTLYGDACSVCSLAVRTEQGSGIVDGAHIMPFAEFHNDDPRNGLALCKNHHWGFDAGWFSITDEYRVVVSPRLVDGLVYLTANASILLPDNALYHPSLDALRWHRESKFLR